MKVSETKRLVLRHFELTDVQYVLRQLNEKSFIQFIADKQVRSLSSAESYLIKGPLASYREFGFGLNIVLLKNTEIPIGMCGLVKRQELEYPDLGFAFFPEFWGKGYATEASRAVLDDAMRTHSLDLILGVTLPNNKASNTLLTRLGFTLNGAMELYGASNNLYEYRELCE